MAVHKEPCVDCWNPCVSERETTRVIWLALLVRSFFFDRCVSAALWLSNMRCKLIHIQSCVHGRCRWFVILLAVAVRFEFEDLQTKEQNKLGDLVDIETTVSLRLWIQGYALKGTYFFSAAVFTSQLLCHITIRKACLHNRIIGTLNNVSYLFHWFNLSLKFNLLFIAYFYAEGWKNWLFDRIFDQQKSWIQKFAAVIWTI